MPNLVGIGNSQVPTNAMLGGLAYQDSVGEINLQKIKARTDDNATDIFIYDTSKDSDGGAWRHKAITQSWYNEKPSQYRGAKKEFPSVAIIVGVQNGNDSYLAIYDGDEPNMPLWMKFVYGTTGSLNAQKLLYADASSVCAMNGVVAVSGNTGWRDGVIQIRFINDDAVWRNTSYIAYWNDTIENRNIVGGYSGFHNGSGQILLGTPHPKGLAMTVNVAGTFREGQFYEGYQSTDPVSGLPIPTIAVATSLGACYITSDDNVWDITGFAPCTQVGFSDRSAFISVETGGTSYMAIGPKEVAFGADAGLAQWEYGGVQYDSSKPNHSHLPQHCGNMMKITKDDEMNMGVYSNEYNRATLYKINIGINLSDKFTQTAALSVYLNQKCCITTRFNSGWMHGNIIGAFLADTDATTMTQSTHAGLIANGDFSSSSTAAFTTVSGGTAAVVGGLLKLTDTAGAFCYASAPFTTVPGDAYFVSVDIVNNSNTAPSNYIRCGNAHNAIDFHNTNYGTGYGTKTFEFHATATTTYLTLISGHGAGNPFGHWDNIIVKRLDSNRQIVSTGNNGGYGLQLYGTINRNPVATGAELVGYSNFSASNYLRMANDTAYNFGSGSQTIMFWAKTSGAGTVMARGASDADESIRIYLDGSTYGVYFDYGTSPQFTKLEHATERAVLTNSRWNFVACQCTANNSNVQIFINGKNMDVTVNSNPPSTFASSSNSTLTIGHSYGSNTFPGELALIRISHDRTSIRTLEKIYKDEKKLFQPNAKCTIYGTSNIATAIGVDDKKGIVHVGTSSGRSDFRGLVRINNTTTAVTHEIDAHDGLIVER